MIPPIDVTGRGAVLLGHDVTCDGFVYGPRYRVQSHVHTDHMHQFSTSKAQQDMILMSEATRELLIAEMDGDLPYRENIIAVHQFYEAVDVGVELLASGHMLGAVQAAVSLPDGMRVGYSGDFQWPLDHVIQVDALVVDSTYGSFESRPHYPHSKLRAVLCDVVMDRVKEGPVFIKAHQGKMERAMEMMSEIANYPQIGTQRLCREVEVYRRYGYTIGRIIDVRSAEGQEALKSRRYIRYFSTHDQGPDDPALGTTIKLSAIVPEITEPLYWDSERALTIPLSDHADFQGTLEYVCATGAKHVVTDSSRGDHAGALADALRTRLGIEARPSSRHFSRAWGT